jgi:predicted permease
MDLRVLGFTLFALMLAVLLSGLAPARHSVRVDVSGILKSGQGTCGVRRDWQKQLLVVGQVAVSVALLGTAAMFFDSLRQANAVRPGMDPRKKLVVLSVGPGRTGDSAAWCEQACERLAALSGIRGATFARRMPLSDSGGGLTTRVEIPGMAPLGMPLNNVGGNYFALMGTRLMAGRAIDAGDRAGAPLVSVVSQDFVSKLFPGRNPIGEWVQIGRKMRQIVGVAEDGPSNYLHEPPQPFVWLPYAQAPSDDITLMIETAGDPPRMAPEVRAELKRFDPRVEIYESGTLQQQMDEALSQDRTLASAAGGLGVIGVLLTAAGLFGLLQFSVNRRTREFGLRMALGAPPAQIHRMVLRESLHLAAWGIPTGMLLLAVAAWSVRSWMLGVTPLHLAAYVFSALTAGTLTIVAAWLPAQRATRVDPMAALRSE